jgi:hypothetical protein
MLSHCTYVWPMYVCLVVCRHECTYVCTSFVCILVLRVLIAIVGSPRIVARPLGELQRTASFTPDSFGRDLSPQEKSRLPENDRDRGTSRIGERD